MESEKFELIMDSVAMNVDTFARRASLEAADGSRLEISVVKDSFIDLFIPGKKVKVTIEPVNE